MHRLHTAILQHTTAHSVHHDWLIEDPRLPDPQHPAARLWTARITPAPARWPALQRFTLRVIPPHRRAYLTYQGEVSNHRGRVRRLAQGTCTARLWSADRIVLEPDAWLGCNHIEMRRLDPDRWLAELRA